MKEILYKGLLNCLAVIGTLMTILGSVVLYFVPVVSVMVVLVMGILCLLIYGYCIKE